MILSKRQQSEHFKLWTRACEAQGWIHLPKVEQDARRHDVYALALDGVEKSFSKLTDGDLDRVTPRIQLLIDPLNIKAQQEVMAYERGEDPGLRRRLLWKVTHMGFSAAYITTIIREQFDRTNVNDLTPAQLDMLRSTLTNRRRSKERRTTYQPF